MWPHQLWPYLAHRPVPYPIQRQAERCRQRDPNSSFISTLAHAFRSLQGGLPPGNAPPGDATEACWMCGREQKTPKQKREKRMTLPCLAGAVRQQLILRNLAILFTFFHHKQVLGSPGWEGHVDKKRKRNHFFFFFFWCAWSIQMNLFYRQALFLESVQTPKCHSQDLR